MKICSNKTKKISVNGWQTAGKKFTFQFSTQQKAVLFKTHKKYQRMDNKNVEKGVIFRVLIETDSYRTQR